MLNHVWAAQHTAKLSLLQYYEATIYRKITVVCHLNDLYAFLTDMG